MRPFTIAIVGRPNVGKSSLFNALLGYRRTIVLDLPGTTQDAVREKVKWSARPLMLVDSQGIFSEKDKAVLAAVLAKADACLFVVDAVVGSTPFDRWIAEQVRLSGLPTLLLANKTESARANSALELAELGFPASLDVSASHRRGLEEIKDWCLSLVGVPETKGDGSVEKAPEAESEPLALALVGRPNTGKSTLMNRLCNESVSRVSPIPHTTRDPVSHELLTPQGPIRLVDTAGMRRPRSKKEPLEVFSIHAATRAIHRADVVFLCLDSSCPITDQDMRLLNLLEREGKPAVILLNFWDRLSSKARKSFFDDTEFAYYLKQFRSIPISALTGFNVDQCLPLAFRLFKQSKKRVKTSRLNEVVERIVSRNPPPTGGRGNFNILYASQVKVEPPTFVFFLNRKGALPLSYQKYLENKLRDALGFKGQPLRVFFRGEKTS